MSTATHTCKHNGRLNTTGHGVLGPGGCAIRIRTATDGLPRIHFDASYKMDPGWQWFRRRRNKWPLHFNNTNKKKSENVLRADRSGHIFCADAGPLPGWLFFSSSSNI